MPMRMDGYIRRGLGMKAHRVVQVRESGDLLVAEVERIDGRKLCCGRCGRRCRWTKGQAEAERCWRDLAYGEKWLVVCYRPWRVTCPTCGVTTEGVPWAQRWSRITYRLSQAVALMARDRDWKATAKFYGVS
jgi:transposase